MREFFWESPTKFYNFAGPGFLPTKFTILWGPVFSSAQLFFAWEFDRRLCRRESRDWHTERTARY